MKKPIALFDIDNTIYRGHSYFELLKKHAEERFVSPGVLTRALANGQKYKMGKQDYETTLMVLLDIYAEGLKGVEYDALLASTKAFYKKSSRFYTFVQPTIAMLQKTHDVALVTGEPQFVAQAVGELFGVKTLYASEYQVKDGRFTGKVEHYLASRHEKLGAVKQAMQSHTPNGSFAFGDSEGDIEMLGAVEHPICLNPTDGLRQVAQQRRWHIAKPSEVQDVVSRLLGNTS